MSTEQNIKLLTWMASNRDPYFLENVVYALEKHTGKKVSTVYYLYGGKEKDTVEIQRVLQDTKKLFSKQLEIVPISAGLFEPDNLQDVMQRMMTTLEPMLNTMGDVCINITAGTNSMSFAWMILKSLDYFRGHATFYDAPKYHSSVHKSNDVINKEQQKISVLNTHDAFNLMTNIRVANRKRQKIELKDSFLGERTRSPLRQASYHKILQYSKVENVPMLILGERGVGKSATVKHLVNNVFKGRKLIEAVCGAMDSNLADSMLFGHQKGAFTGAVANHKGLFEQADKGILFLDEIQDIPRSTQRKLLRTIQEKDHPYSPLGSESEKKANVQLIFASNNTMEQLYEKLDPDFLDRIKMFTVRLPSLRECKVDIQDDWQTIWNSSLPANLKLGDVIIPENAPWEGTGLPEFFSDDINLEGNMRSLQKVAYQIIARRAWDIPEEINLLLEELKQENIETHNCLQKIKAKSESAENGGNATATANAATAAANRNWDEAVKFFKESLAMEAVKRCGMSIPKAAKELACDKNTISKALPEEFKLQLKQGKA